jgi:hypothetical protein
VESHYCYDDTGCEVTGQLKDFKICPQCETAWYCGVACEKHDCKLGGVRRRGAHLLCKLAQIRAPLSRAWDVLHSICSGSIPSG